MSLAKQMPQEIKELILSGNYKLYHSFKNQGFIVVELPKILKFDECGHYQGELHNILLEKYEQVPVQNPQELIDKIEFLITNFHNQKAS